MVNIAKFFLHSLFADDKQVSQFTLLASLKKNKPSFHQSATGENAKILYKAFFNKVQELYEPERVKDGLFAAMMDVALVNDGPVGIDFTCLDGEVQPQYPSLSLLLSFMSFSDPRHRSQYKSTQIHQR